MCLTLSGSGTASAGTPPPGNDSLITRSFQKFTDHLCSVFVYIYSSPDLPSGSFTSASQTRVSLHFCNSNSDFFVACGENSKKIRQFQAI